MSVFAGLAGRVVRGWPARPSRRRTLSWCGTLAHLALGAGSLTRPAGAAAQTAADSARRTLQAVRTAAPLTIDGRLDEPVWATAPAAGDFTQVEPLQGVPSAFATTVRVVYDGEQLVFGFVVRDSLGARGIRVQDLRRKFDYFQNDLVGVSLDPFLDRRNAIAFQVSPYGAQRELQVYDGTTYNREWEAVWRVRTQVTDSGWTAEVAVPWATLRYPAGATTFGVNFHRVARRANEQSGWVPWPRNLNPYRMDFAGELRGLAPPPPSSNLRARPYLVTDAVRTRTAGVGRTDISPSVGGELIWSPAPNTVVDATIFTDFAQADVDRQVVNLRRFSVFFPERRQFFLENRSLFDVGLEDNLTTCSRSSAARSA